MAKKPLFERNEKVIFKETGEVVTVSRSWYASNDTERVVPSYDLFEYPSSWYSESELEKRKTSE